MPCIPVKCLYLPMNNQPFLTLTKRFITEGPRQWQFELALLWRVLFCRSVSLFLSPFQLVLKYSVNLIIPFLRCSLQTHTHIHTHTRLPLQLSSKESTCQCRRHGLDPWFGKIPWRREWQPTSVFLPGIPWTEEPGPVGYNPGGVSRSRIQLSD